MARSIEKKIFILSGAKGVGKTTLVREVIAWTKEQNYSVEGICSPAIFHDHKKIGIQIEDVTTGEYRTLATALGELNSSITTDAWSFDEKNLEWGNQILESIKKCKLLVIDELGILEIAQHRGWSQAIPVLKNLDYELAIVVVRPDLCEHFKKTVCAKEIVHLDSDNHSIIFQQIISEIKNTL